MELLPREIIDYIQSLCDDCDKYCLSLTCKLYNKKIPFRKAIKQACINGKLVDYLLNNNKDERNYKYVFEHCQLDFIKNLDTNIIEMYAGYSRSLDVQKLVRGKKCNLYRLPESLPDKFVEAYCTKWRLTDDLSYYFLKDGRRKFALLKFLISKGAYNDRCYTWCSKHEKVALAKHIIKEKIWCSRTTWEKLDHLGIKSLIYQSNLVESEDESDAFIKKTTLSLGIDLAVLQNEVCLEMENKMNFMINELRESGRLD